jgi:putative mRNA 3-end processing factor
LINNFLTKTTAGLYCPIADFYLDPKRSVTRALVSHAHGDHAVRSKGDVYCTAPTRSFMIHRHGENPNTKFTIVNYSIPFYIDAVKITFYPAGHILGSAQILLEYEGERYLYTGDFKTQLDESCESFEVVECDHLITETTFASPEYNHPDPVHAIKSVAEGSNRVIIGAYSLGKAQRLTRLITETFPGTNVYIHPELENYHRLYETHGYPLGKWKSYRRDEFDNDEKAFYIVPPSYLKKYSLQPNVLSVFATGWKRSFYRCDRVLHISDHADWNGVLNVVTSSKAKKVYTVHGNGSLLKEYLKDKIEVKIIG